MTYFVEFEEEYQGIGEVELTPVGLRVKLGRKSKTMRMLDEITVVSALFSKPTEISIPYKNVKEVEIIKRRPGGILKKYTLVGFFKRPYIHLTYLTEENKIESLTFIPYDKWGRPYTSKFYEELKAKISES